MTGTEAAVIVFLTVAIIVLTVVLGSVMKSHGRERHEWALERRSLVDRAIAQHSGEVIALDRAANRTEREKGPPVLIEGLT